MYGREVQVLTDSNLLKHVLNFNGDNLEVNRLLMKVKTFNVVVEVKPESFRALCFSKMLNEEISYQV